MSISTEITRLQNAKLGLKTSINAKTDEQHKITTETLEDYSDFVDSISSGITPKGYILENYDSNGYPTTGKFVGSWETIPANYMVEFQAGNNFLENIKKLTLPNDCKYIQSSAFKGNRFEEIELNEGLVNIGSSSFSFNSYLDSITIPSSVTTISAYAFRNCIEVESVTFLGNVTNINNSVFATNTETMLYDFSNHTGTIPTLYSSASLGHKQNCVIKVPSSLLTAWQTATNWSSLTDVVWEGV